MKRMFATAATSLLVVWMVGCSDDNTPTGGGGTNPPAFVDTTTFDSTTAVFTTVLDASDQAVPKRFSFSDGSITPAPKVALGGTWDIEFSRTNINLNGGASSDGGNVRGANLGTGKLFADVTIADTTGAEWKEDELNSVISDWLSYNPITHQLDMTGFVYTMLDAEGDNYVKFRIDSLVGAAMPPDMGTAWISYFYQPTAKSTDLSGTVQTASITVGAGEGYFDFSLGSQVFPTNPSNSTAWDLKFENYEVFQNSGPNGTGECAAFQAYTTLTDSTAIETLTAVPAGAPFFPDFVSSVFNGSLTDDAALWYDYNPETHILTSKGCVYLIDVDGTYYKMQLVSYYADVAGAPASAHYTFVWKEL